MTILSPHGTVSILVNAGFRTTKVACLRAVVQHIVRMLRTVPILLHFFTSMISINALVTSFLNGRCRPKETKTINGSFPHNAVTFVHGIRLLCISITEYYIGRLSLHINDITDGWFTIFGESREWIMHNRREIVRHAIIDYFRVPFSLFKRTGQSI